jgi:hypothetical protein
MFPSYNSLDLYDLLGMSAPNTPRASSAKPKRPPVEAVTNYQNSDIIQNTQNTTNGPSITPLKTEGSALKREYMYTQAQIFSDVKNGLQRRIETETDTEQLEMHIATLQQQISLVKKYELRILDLLENPSIAAEIKDKIFLSKARARTLFTRLMETGSIDLRGDVHEEQKASCKERGKFQALLESVLPDAEGFISSVDLYNQLKHEEKLLADHPDSFDPMLCIIHLASEIETKQSDRSVVSISFYPTLKTAALKNLKAVVPAIRRCSVNMRDEMEAIRHDPTQTVELLKQCRHARNNYALYDDAIEKVPFRKELESDLLLVNKELAYLATTIGEIETEKMAEKNTAYLLAVGRGIAIGAAVTLVIAIPTIGSSILISAVSYLLSPISRR